VFSIIVAFSSLIVLYCNFCRWRIKILVKIGRAFIVNFSYNYDNRRLFSENKPELRRKLSYTRQRGTYEENSFCEYNQGHEPRGHGRVPNTHFEWRDWRAIRPLDFIPILIPVRLLTRCVLTAELRGGEERSKANSLYVETRKEMTGRREYLIATSTYSGLHFGVTFLEVRNVLHVRACPLQFAIRLFSIMLFEMSFLSKFLSVTFRHVLHL